MDSIRLTPTDPARSPVGFDFTAHVRRLCADLAGRLDELGHVDMDRVAIRFCQARKAVRHGLQASLTPLRFEGGLLVTLRRGRPYTIQRLYDEAGRELLYLLSFYLPRFLELTFEEKLITVLHELWHIGPRFDGDLRRHPGRCYAHSCSQQQYDLHMAALAERWLAAGPPASLYAFLQCSFKQLRAQYGAVFGMRIPTPKLIRRDFPISQAS